MTEAKQVSRDTILGNDGKRGGILLLLGRPLFHSALPCSRFMFPGSIFPGTSGMCGVGMWRWRMWREYARVHKIVSSVCMVELQSKNSRGSLPESRILPVCQRYVLIIPVVEGEVIVLDWPEKSSSGLVSPYEIRRCKRSCRRSVGGDQ